MNVGLTSIKVKEEVGNVTILINNAGVVTGKPFLNTPDHMVERSFLINALSHFWVSLHSFSLYFVGKYENAMCFCKQLFSHLSVHVPFVNFLFIGHGLPIQVSPCRTLSLAFPVLALFQTLRLGPFPLSSLVWSQDLLACSKIFPPKYKQNVEAIV